MNLKGYVPLAGALIGIVVQTSLIVTGTQPGRGTLWISIVTSLLLGLFLMVMMMAAQFADSNLAVRGLIVLVLLGLAFNVFVNFMALTEREGLAMDSTYQLVTLIALAVVFVIGGLAFATSYGRKFSDAAAAMATLDEEPWEANAPAADQLKLTLGRMQAMARVRGVGVPTQASPAQLRALGADLRDNRNRPSPLAAMRARSQYAREMATQVKSARLAGYGALRQAPQQVMAVGGPVDEGMGAAAGMAGAPAGPGAGAN